MEGNYIIVILHNHKRGTQIDIEIPRDISVNELIIGLNETFSLGMTVENMGSCYLKTENPIALLKGNKSIEEYGVRNGTTIHITE